MEMGYKPCQDQFLHPILVHCKKIQVAKWGTKINIKTTTTTTATTTTAATGCCD
jgi:hypothetical protein